MILQLSTPYTDRIPSTPEKANPQGAASSGGFRGRWRKGKAKKCCLLWEVFCGCIRILL